MFVVAAGSSAKMYEQIGDSRRRAISSPLAARDAARHIETLVNTALQEWRTADVSKNSNERISRNRAASCAWEIGEAEAQRLIAWIISFTDTPILAGHSALVSLLPMLNRLLADLAPTAELDHAAKTTTPVDRTSRKCPEADPLSPSRPDDTDVFTPANERQLKERK